MEQMFMGIFSVIGACLLGYHGTKYLCKTYDPMDSYDESSDAELNHYKAQLLTKTIRDEDIERINKIERLHSGIQYKFKFISYFFSNNNNMGLVFHYDDEMDEKRHMALIRPDGKILSRDKGHSMGYNQRSIFKAQNLNGYLVGTDVNGSFFFGKHYPIYQFKK